MKYFLFVLLSISSICESRSKDLGAQHLLREQYRTQCRGPSDIHEHLPHLKRLAKECSSVVEVGMRTMNSSWALLQGLAESSLDGCSYIGIDLNAPPKEIFNRAQNLAIRNGISFVFFQANDMDIDIEPTDLLFIDTLHTYCHLTYELEKFAPKVGKYIAMHDTDEPFGFVDDFWYEGNYSEYPETIDRSKKGLWLAVQDFLARHPEWSLSEHYYNNHGFTVLKRQ